MNTIERKLLPIARKWAGNIPIWEAKEQGIDPSAIRHWAQNNPDVENNTRGVYTWFADDDQIDWAKCSTARILAKAGKGAYLWGPSVLELMEIGDVAGPITSIAVPTRRRPQEAVRWVVTNNESNQSYGNLPIQPLADALASSMPLLDTAKRIRVLEDTKRRFPSLAPLSERLKERYVDNA